MRVVAGRPDPIAQTPMMNAFIRYEALNPYWNSPADITSRKLAPTILKEGRAYFKNRGYEVLSDWSDHAHVIDPMSINWHAVAAGQKVRMRQKPGPANSMGKMKFMFPNPQGIWLHDTPEKEKIDEAARLQSNGCVRLEDAPRLARWLFNGRPPKTQGAKPEQKVNLPAPVPLYITYLTAVPSGTSIVYFDDFYGKDRTAARGRSRAVLAAPRAGRCTTGASSCTCRLVALGREAAEVEGSSNWTPNLPACAQRTTPRTGPTPTMSMVSSVPGATGIGHSTKRPIDEMLRSLTSSVSPSMLVIARRISRWRGSRMHWKPSASTVTLLASSRAAPRRPGVPKM